MNSTQDFAQGDQVLAVVTAPVLLAETPSLPRSCAREVESQENEVREPLKELCKNDKESSENPEQEQEQEGENNDGTDKINDYVVKVLEKLVNQRGKTGKLSTILEKKGLVSEKRSPKSRI